MEIKLMPRHVVVFGSFMNSLFNYKMGPVGMMVELRYGLSICPIRCP